MEKLYQELLMDINNNLYINKIKKNTNSRIFVWCAGVGEQLGIIVEMKNSAAKIWGRRKIMNKKWKGN